MGKIGWIIFGVIVLIIVILGIGFYMFVKSGCDQKIDKNVAIITPEVKNAVKDAFADPDKKIYIYPSERVIEIEPNTIGKGFAFSVRNNLNQTINFRYIVGVDPNYNLQEKCKISIKDAENYLLTSSGTLYIKNNSILEEPELIRFNIPDNPPNCVIKYMINVINQNNTYVTASIFVSLTPKKNIFTKFKEFMKTKFYDTIC